MPFHVQVAGSLNHARAFNLSLEELRRQVLEPWLTGRTLELGEQEWDPRESSLKILEGKHLDPADLSFGQGWANAERSAQDVTKRILETTETPKLPDAFIVEAELPEATVAEMLSGQTVLPIPLGDAEKKITGRDPEVAAVILVTKKSPG
ncbi:MAG TPA: hypothetical protein VFN89_10135 [Solirubrobacterales bacterium]|nr:hypothetical protein [Solirubrobacterales bacterium]